MLAYKFRSAHDMQFAFDILINKRLHCSDWRNLNDPMEGMFAYSYHSSDESDHSKEVDEIIRHKKRLLVCSLSMTFDCHLLWAHYASGFSGLAIEVDLPDASPLIRRVQYRGVFAGVNFTGPINPAQTAEDILSSKYREWSYEREARILQHEEWFALMRPIRRVIAGHRMHPALFAALHIVCDREKITLCKTGIGDQGIDADPVPPLDLSARPRQGRGRRKKKVASDISG